MSFHGTGAGRIAEAVREGLTYANVMATTAVFIALGGSAWALTAKFESCRARSRGGARRASVVGGILSPAG
jgi:hypothetical protein